MAGESQEYWSIEEVGAELGVSPQAMEGLLGLILKCPKMWTGGKVTTAGLTFLRLHASCWCGAHPWPDAKGTWHHCTNPQGEVASATALVRNAEMVLQGHLMARDNLIRRAVEKGTPTATIAHAASMSRQRVHTIAGSEIGARG